MRLTDFDKLSEGLGDWLREQYPGISERIEGKKILHIDGMVLCQDLAQNKMRSSDN